MYNKVILMGRLIRDPELKTTAKGTEVMSFCIVVDRPYVKGREKISDFINCTAWRGTAVFIEKFFKKGSLIRVEGSIQNRSYTNSAGQKVTLSEVQVSDVGFTGERRNDVGHSTLMDFEANQDGGQVGTADFANVDIESSDLPF